MSFTETGKKSRRSRSVKISLSLRKLEKLACAHQNKNWKKKILFLDSKIYQLYNDLYFTELFV